MGFRFVQKSTTSDDLERSKCIHWSHHSQVTKIRWRHNVRLISVLLTPPHAALQSALFATANPFVSMPRNGIYRVIKILRISAKEIWQPQYMWFHTYLDRSQATNRRSNISNCKAQAASCSQFTAEGKQSHYLITPIKYLTQPQHNKNYTIVRKNIE